MVGNKKSPDRHCRPGLLEKLWKAMFAFQLNERLTQRTRILVRNRSKRTQRHGHFVPAREFAAADLRQRDCEYVVEVQHLSFNKFEGRAS